MEEQQTISIAEIEQENKSEEQQTITIAEIEQEKESDNNPKIIKFELSDGKKVEMDFEKANVRILMKARLQQEQCKNAVSQSLFVLALICKIDGKEYSVDEILDLDIHDYVLMEQVYLNKKKPQTD